MPEARQSQTPALEVRGLCKEYRRGVPVLLYLLLVVVPVVQAQFNVVTEFPASQRGEGGYGSTGKG